MPKIRCPKCKATFSTADVSNGQRVSCFSCGMRLKVLLPISKPELDKALSETVEAKPTSSIIRAALVRRDDKTAADAAKEIHDQSVASPSPAIWDEEPSTPTSMRLGVLAVCMVLLFVVAPLLTLVIVGRSGADDVAQEKPSRKTSQVTRYTGSGQERDPISSRRSDSRETSKGSKPKPDNEDSGKQTDDSSAHPKDDIDKDRRGLQDDVMPRREPKDMVSGENGKTDPKPDDDEKTPEPEKPSEVKDANERYPNGKAKSTRKGGVLTYYYPDGRKLSVTTFKDGTKTKREDFAPNGTLLASARFSKGNLCEVTLHQKRPFEGFVEEIKSDGPVVPHLPGDVQLHLATVAALPKPKNNNEMALRRLQQFRAVTGLAYEDMSLDDEYGRKSQAGTELLQTIGKGLSHTPDQPKGYPDQKYKVGYEGTSHSNLDLSFSTGHNAHTLPDSVDDYMDDSDAANINRVGHRRWCLNPPMLKTGFGMSAGATGHYYAMWSMDKSRKNVPDYDYVAYPPPGFVPVEMFGKRHEWNVAWSIQFNPNKFSTDRVQAKVFAVTGKAKQAVDLDFHGADNSGMGIPNCLIFRPRKWELVPGLGTLSKLTGSST